MRKYSITALALAIAMTICASVSDEQLIESFNSITSSENDSVSCVRSDEFAALLVSRLKETGFEDNLAAITGVGKIVSDDNQMRVLTWNYALSGGEYGYGVIFQSQNGKVYQANCHKAFKAESNKSYNAGNWYGALYYSMIKSKDKYLLLGYSTYNNITKVKLIDIVSFKNNGFTLGENIFNAVENSKKTSRRVVFEYNADVNMTLTYETSKRRFVFDHLSPEEPFLKDLYQYYGPDFTVDALRLKKKVWTLQPNIDIKNK